MSESRGAVLVALVMAAIVALAIIFPALSEKPVQIVTESPGPAGSAAPSTATFTALQKNDIRNTVREYLLDNPQVIVEAIEALQAQQQAGQQQQNHGAIAANREQLFNTRHDPFIGNPDASVTIVEFFDYQCPYCKQMAQDLVDIAAEDPDVKIVFKEFPVFGRESTLAARAALASAKQGKYAEFHLAVMEMRGAPSENALFRVAARLGMDLDRLRRDMQSPSIETQIQTNLQLARQVGVRGTPAFIIGDQLVPGAVSAEQMRQLIIEKRGS
ncbi:MAG: DsbA family protein [Proteobacteria bacterium]|nr:DsbA family protein [Pseudomonadota bacterium]